MKYGKSKTQDMTTGPILQHLITFSLPLLFGNVFQMLYNTVDSIVVGNFVGKTAEGLIQYQYGLKRLNAVLVCVNEKKYAIKKGI